MIDYQLQVTGDKITIKQLDKLSGNIAYAMSLALNDAVFAARPKVLTEEVDASFEFKSGSARKFMTKGLRPGAEGPGGVGIHRANKRKLEARVFYGEGLEFLRLHEDSGIKHPSSFYADMGLMIPESSTVGRKIVKKKDLALKVALGAAGASTGGRGPPVFRLGKGTKHDRIVERTKGTEKGLRVGSRGKVKRRKSRLLRTLFWLEPRAKVEKSIDVEDRVFKLVDRRMPDMFQARLTEVLAKEYPDLTTGQAVGREMGWM